MQVGNDKDTQRFADRRRLDRVRLRYVFLHLAFYGTRRKHQPGHYPEVFRLKPEDLMKLPEVPAIPPLRQKTG